MFLAFVNHENEYQHNFSLNLLHAVLGIVFYVFEGVDYNHVVKYVLSLTHTEMLLKDRLCKMVGY